MRWKKNVYMSNSINKYNFNFYTKNKNRAGRSKFGYLLVYSKGCKKSNYYLFYDQKRLWSKQASILLNYNFLYNKKLLGLVKYVNGSLSLIKLAHGQCIGFIIKSLTFSTKIYKSILLGCRVFLGLLKKSFIVFDVTLNSNSLSKFAKSSGTYCQIIDFNLDLGLVLLKLPSMEKKYFSYNCIATLGRNANIFSKFRVQGGAGFNFNKGIKPIVRGVAMNPVDHPHGGRTKTNKPEVSPWGWVTKHSH